MFKVGNPYTHDMETEEYEDPEEAEEAARLASVDDCLWAVYDVDDDKIVSLAFGMKVFSS